MSQSIKAIKEMVQQYNKPVMYGQLKYPGDEKNSIASVVAYSQLLAEIKSKFVEDVLFFETCHSIDGSSFIMVYDDKAVNLKKLAVDIEENHPLGLMFDINVYGVDGKSLTRSSLEMPRRINLLKEITVDKKITYKIDDHKELIKYADSLVNTYMCDTVYF